jgi:hypothetical protein
MLSQDLSILDDAPEGLSTLEVLDDISDIVESVVLGLGGEAERDAYLTLTDQYDEYADSVAAEPADRTPEESVRLSELEERMIDAFDALLAGCPDHIRKLHEALRGAIDAEEAERD